MSTLRVTELAATSVPSVATVALRVTNLSNVGANVTLSVSGPTTARAGQSVTLTAVVSDGSIGAVTFRQTAGPTVSLSTSGNQVTFLAPTLTTSAPVNVTVVATLARPGTSDTTATKTVAVSPVAELYLSPVSLTWEPRVAYLLKAPPVVVDTYSPVYKSTY